MLRGVIDTRGMLCSGRMEAGSVGGEAPMQGGGPEAEEEPLHVQQVKESQPPDAPPDAAAATLLPNGVVAEPPPLLLPAGALPFCSWRAVAALSGALY